MVVACHLQIMKSSSETSNLTSSDRAQFKGVFEMWGIVALAVVLFISILFVVFENSQTKDSEHKGKKEGDAKAV
jgi:hypothetical protein